MSSEDDILKKALEAAAAKSGMTAEELLKKKGYDAETPSPAPEKGSKTLRVERSRPPNPEPLPIRKKGPIWPMDDDQLAQWLKDMALLAETRKTKPKEAPLTAERRAEIHKLAAEHAARFVDRFKPVTKAVVKEVKQPAAEKKSTRQKRLGQTKLIDELIKQGKSEKEIFDAVREKIPEYPEIGLPKLIRLRQYHSKKK